MPHPDDPIAPSGRAEPPLAWTAGILNGYARAFLLFALEETGVLTALRQAGEAGATAAELAAERDLDPQLLAGALDYLAHADMVVVKRGDRFAPGERARWPLGDTAGMVSHLYVGAYSCLLSELLPALRGEKAYGVDFTRAAEQVALGSHLAARQLYPVLAAELARHGVETVVDLGCGAAHLLVDLCSREERLRGVGIDIAPRALAAGRWSVRASGLADRIRLLQGDIARPASYASGLGSVGAFHAGFVLHELLRDGDEALVDLLVRMRERFPGAYLLVSEFDALSDGEYQALPLEQRIIPLFYQHLIHPLSRQGSPQPEARWRRLFARAGLELLRVRREAARLPVYVLRFPPGGEPRS